MKYGMWNLGQIEALLNKVGEDNARKLLDCREVTVTFDTGDKCATIIADAPALTVCKTVKIGTGVKSGKAFCSELESKDFRIGDWARDMLGQKVFTVAIQEEEVDLVCLFVADSVSRTVPATTRSVLAPSRWVWNSVLLRWVRKSGCSTPCSTPTTLVTIGL